MEDAAQGKRKRTKSDIYGAEHDEGPQRGVREYRKRQSVEAPAAFEHRINFTGTVMALRMGLDTVVPQDAQVPDNAAALRPAVVHGRALAMRAAAIRTCMRKHPTKHKPKPQPKIVTAAAAVMRQQTKEKVYSLAQYQHCRSFGCKLGGSCNEATHILPARRKEEARTKALAVTCSREIPGDDVLGLLTRPQLDAMCRQLRLSRAGNKDDVKTRLAEARAAAQEAAAQGD